MVQGTLPWDSIRDEVRLAVRNYMQDEHGQMKATITLPYLVDYIYYSGKHDLYPHLTGVPWDTVEARCGEAIRSMNWKRYSRRVYVVPYGKRGGVVDGSVVGVEA